MRLEEAIEIFNENFLVLKLGKMSHSELWKRYNRSIKKGEMMPLAYVRKDGRISFNEAAKKFESIEEIREVLTKVWKYDYGEMIILLTRSGRELAEISPKLRIVDWGVSLIKERK